MVLYVDLNCSLRINSATQGYNVVLCCLMIAAEGCIVLLKAFSRSLLNDVNRHGVD